MSDGLSQKKRDAWLAAEAGAIPSMGEIGLNHFAPYLMNRVSARWNARMSEMLTHFDLTTTKMRALAVLSVASGMTVNELSAFAVTEQSTMSRTLDALEDAGLIMRQPKAGDMRVREVFITTEGLALFARVWPEMYDMFAHMFRNIDDAEFRGFISTLHKMLRNVQDV